MNVVDIEKLIELGWCSRDYIERLQKRYSDDEVQIILAIMTGNETVETLVELTDYSKEQIVDICKRYYEEYKKEKEDSFNNSNLGWGDSTRWIQNK